MSENEIKVTEGENAQPPQKKVKKKKTKLEKWFRTMRRFEFIVLRRIFPFKKHGNLKKYNDGAYIIVGNHYSVYDVAFSCMLTDRPVHFAAKVELWDKKIMRYFCNKCECIPVNRDGNDVKAVMQMLKLLKSGEVINIFPEGTRNHSYDSFLPFKSGAAALAIKAKVPIIPFVEMTRVKPFKTTHIVVGEPLEFTEYYGKRLTDDIVKECDDKIRDTLWALRTGFLEEQEQKKQAKKDKKGKKA